MGERAGARDGGESQTSSSTAATWAPWCFPDADLKIFLVADPWERARRRLCSGSAARPTDDEIAEETDRIVQRDAKDATQTVQAKDAVLIDTTYLTQEDQVERIVALAQRP